MADTVRPHRQPLYPTPTGDSGAVRVDGGTSADVRPFDHDFAVIRARADEWRARSEHSVTFADGGEGMGV